MEQPEEASMGNGEYPVFPGTGSFPFIKAMMLSALRTAYCS
jgi:hypothetical protein